MKRVSKLDDPEDIPMRKRPDLVSESPLSLANAEKRRPKLYGNKRLMRVLSVVALMGLFCFETSSLAASPGLFGRFRRTRARNNVQRTTNYRTYNYQRNVSRNYRPTASKDPWWMSEPAFRSQRTRTLYSHLGYPNAFE